MGGRGSETTAREPSAVQSCQFLRKYEKRLGGGAAVHRVLKRVETSAVVYSRGGHRELGWRFPCLVKFLLFVFFDAANRLGYCCCVFSGWTWNKCVLLV